MQDTYEVHFEARINAAYSGAYGRLSGIASFPLEAALGVLREIVETGCLSQNARNITLAREALAQLPPDWAAQHLPEVVSACLFQELGWEDWEFRRLAEMLEEGFPAAFAWLLDYAGNLYDPEVDEAVVDYRAAGASLK